MHRFLFNIFRICIESYFPPIEKVEMQNFSRQKFHSPHGVVAMRWWKSWNKMAWLWILEFVSFEARVSRMLSMLFPRLCSCCCTLSQHCVVLCCLCSRCRTLSLIEMNLLGGGQQSGLMALAFILLTHFGDTIPKDINQTIFFTLQIVFTSSERRNRQEKRWPQMSNRKFRRNTFLKMF